ncbi:MAG: hypothetical protein ACK4P4_02620 [Allorhizobium sp.]
MLAVNSFNNIAALTLLKGDSQNSVSSFLSSSVFKVQSTEIFSAVSTAFSSADFQEQYTEALKFFSDAGTLSGGQKASDDNIKHNALTDVIIKNRASFPPEEFTIHTDLGGGASITTTIPSIVSMKGDLFAADVAKKQAAFDEAITLENAEPDPELVKLNAMAQVVKTLVVDGQDADASVTLLNESERNPGRGYEQEQETVGN